MGILFATGDTIAIPSLRLLHKYKTISAILAPSTNANNNKKNKNTAYISEFALQHKIPLLQPSKLDGKLTQSLNAYTINLLVCFAYGKYFTNSFLSYFSRGAINVHPSLLPRYRGAAPITASILAGEGSTGITIQTISSQLDAGDIIHQVHIPIHEHTNATLLRERVATMVADPLLYFCKKLLSGAPITYTKQHDNKAIYCRKINKADGKVLWSMPAQHIIRLVKSMHYWPIAHTYFNGTKLNIIETEPRPLTESVLSKYQPIKTIPFGTVLGVHNQYGILVSTGKDIVGVQKLQLATKKAQHWKDFFNGHRAIVGSTLQ